MTEIFKLIQKRNHEAVVFCSDAHVGLRGIISVHDTTLGPGLGGIRVKQYKNDEDALVDVLKLSRAMTYKASAAGLNLGGGKSVIMLEPGQQKTPELLAAFADRIHMLGGRYIAAGDVGSNTNDLKIIKQHTPWVGGLAQEDGGLGDSSILTALGVFMGIKAAVKFKHQSDSMKGLKVAVQGAGKVGYHLVEHLLEAGCDVVVSDMNPDTVNSLCRDLPQVKACAPEEIYFQPVDIFSPNAVGGLLTEEIAQKMTCTIVAGGANNPLASEAVAKALHQKGILYAPDFLINAGGIIVISCELEQLTFERAKSITEGIYDRTLKVFDYAEANNLLPWDSAQQLAVQRIHAYRDSQKGHPVLTGSRPIVGADL